MKPLIETNPYLKNEDMRNHLFKVTSYSSSAVEGVKMPIKSKAQMRAMQAAAHRKSTIGIPKKVAKEYISSGKVSKNLPEKKRRK